MLMAPADRGLRTASQTIVLLLTLYSTDLSRLTEDIQTGYGMLYHVYDCMLIRNSGIHGIAGVCAFTAKASFEIIVVLLVLLG